VPAAGLRPRASGARSLATLGVPGVAPARRRRLARLRRRVPAAPGAGPPPARWAPSWSRLAMNAPAGARSAGPAGPRGRGGDRRVL